MNKYLKLIIMMVVIVAGFLGVKVLYDRLADDYKPDNNLVVNESKATESVTESGEVATEGQSESAKVSTEESAPSVTTEETGGNTSEEAASEDIKAMDFTVVDGENVETTLLEHTGKPIVVNFWASWCGPCKSELPDFEQAYLEMGTEVEFMMVNLTDGRSETMESATQFIASQGYTFPVYYDVKQSAASTYYVVSIPTTYFIDAKGNIAAYAQGMIDYETIMKGINMATE